MLHSGCVPTKHPRHAVTETPAVRDALDELRRETGDDRVVLSELVILGAREKVARIRAARDTGDTQRRRLADRVRQRTVPVDRAAADEVRRSGWARA